MTILVLSSAGPAVAPLAAVDGTSPDFASFANDLRDLVPSDQLTTLAGATEADGTADQFHPSGQEPGIATPETDIALAASFDVEVSPAAYSAASGPGGILNCDTPSTVCSATRAGQLAGTSFHAYAGSTQAPFLAQPGRRVEIGVVAFDETPRDGRPAARWEAIPEFPGDYFAGSNVAWTLLSENGEPRRLLRLEYGPGDAGFLASNTDAVALIRGSSWVILVPRAEWDGTLDGRLYVFRADGGNFEAATSVVDTYPDIASPPRPSSGSPTITLASAASGRATAIGVDARWLALIAIGALLALVGLWLVVGRRFRGSAGSGASRTRRGAASSGACGDLLTAWEEARAACDDAQRAANETRETRGRLAADEGAARDRLRQATRARKISARAELDASLEGAQAAEDEARAAVEQAHAATLAAAKATRAAAARGLAACRRATAAEAAYRACFDEVRAKD